jgi:hypothetical protein
LLDFELLLEGDFDELVDPFPPLPLPILDGRMVPLLMLIPPLPLPIFDGRTVPVPILIPPFPPDGRVAFGNPLPDPFPLIAGMNVVDFDDPLDFEVGTLERPVYETAVVVENGFCVARSFSATTKEPEAGTDSAA